MFPPIQGLSHAMLTALPSPQLQREPYPKSTLQGTAALPEPEE